MQGEDPGHASRRLASYLFKTVGNVFESAVESGFFRSARFCLSSEYSKSLITTKYFSKTEGLQFPQMLSFSSGGKTFDILRVSVQLCELGQVI